MCTAIFQMDYIDSAFENDPNLLIHDPGMEDENNILSSMLDGLMQPDTEGGDDAADAADIDALDAVDDFDDFGNTNIADAVDAVDYVGASPSLVTKPPVNQNITFDELFNSAVQDSTQTSPAQTSGGGKSRNKSTTNVRGRDAKDANALEDVSIDMPFSKNEPMDPDPALHVDDLTSILYSAFKWKGGAAGHHIRAMNEFYNKGLPTIITEIFSAEAINLPHNNDSTEKDKEIDTVSFRVKFEEARLKKPVISSTNGKGDEALFPYMAAMRDIDYTGQLVVKARVDIVAVKKNGDKETISVPGIDNWQIGEIPVMTMSDRCHLNGLTHEELKAVKADPHTIGASFILGGKEISVNCLEQLLINKLHCYKNMHGRERARGTFQSKPGDSFENSYYMVLKYLTNGEITIMIMTEKTKALEIPFYLLFRAFGMTSDEEIINTIVQGLESDDKISHRMLHMLEIAINTPRPKKDDPDFNKLHSEINPNVILRIIANKIDNVAQNMDYTKSEDAIKVVNKRIRHQLDKLIFPHIGSSEDDRVKKLRYLADLINQLLLVEMEILESTDRDSYRSKRVHTAGVLISKAFKQQFNYLVIRELRRALVQNFEQNPWEEATQPNRIKQIVVSAVAPESLAKGMSNIIKSSQEKITIKQHEFTNRISTQASIPKNDLNLKAIASSITSHGKSAAKATDRATLIRMVQPSYDYIIGQSHSADSGESVGMSKQLTVGATICEASSSNALKLILLADPDIVRESSVLDPIDKQRDKLTSIYVNGDHIGFCRDGYALAQKYRMARRHNFIDRLTTIVKELHTRKIYFWCDFGRIITPFIVVYNNLAELDAEIMRHRTTGDKSDIKFSFKQWTKLTRAHIDQLHSGEIDMDDLIEMGVIEYLAPEEIENIYCAESYNEFVKSIGDIEYSYTHVAIEQNIFGLVELSAPNTNHTPATRITYFTNQKKQTCGWFQLNWPYRMDKNTSLQYHCQIPLVYVFANNITYPNSHNAVVAYQCYRGDNVEDACIGNRSSFARGLFTTSFFNYEYSQLENGESFGIADHSKTLDLKNKEGIYEYLDERGFIKVGTKVKKGYVLIAKKAKLMEPTDKHQYTDKSVIYKLDNPAYVEEVFHNRDGTKEFVKVKLRSFRPARIGDKVSSHSGNKSIIASTLDEAVMPYSETGLIPDLILNPHAIPTRMIIGQLIEAVQANLAAKKGCLIDATPFKRFDIREMIEELKKYGVVNGGYHRMYNGKTGEWIDTLIFMAPTGYQRLQKFIIDESRYINTGPTQALTRQPYDGKAYDGGLRLGEMEVWVFSSHGAMRALHEKLYAHSDAINIFVCRVCENRAYVSEENNILQCKYCGDAAEIVRIPSAWCSNLFFNLINAMGLRAKFKPEPYYRLSES